MIRILLVDDHKVVREGLKAYLAGEPDLAVVGEADDGRAAAKLAGELTPDVILMDLVMPRCDGIEGTRLCLQASPRSRVAVLTSMPDDERVMPALRAGALSYLLKDVSAAELAAAIRTTAAGKATLNPLAAAKMVAELHPAKKAAVPANALSPREREVLTLVAQGLGNQEIGDRLFIGERTVKTHVHNLLAKLGLDDRTQLAIYALKNGLA
jgi:NarL family two-component system response regulator LiaR